MEATEVGCVTPLEGRQVATGPELGVTPGDFGNGLGIGEHGF